MPSILSVQEAPENSGDGQSDTALATLANPLRVQVLRDGQPAAGVGVSWTTSAGSLSPLTTTTDVDGIASVSWTLGPEPGSLTAEAAVENAAGSPVVFTATAMPRPPIVSEPVSAGLSANAEPLGAPSANEGVVYVSLPSGTVTQGSHVVVRNLETGFTVQQPIMDGGSDPSALPASVGDEIAVSVYAATNVVAEYTLAVPARVPPIVVRTEPPPRKRDVPLNASLIVVFSEPIDPASLTASSIQLFRGTTAIAGTLRMLPGNGTVAAFTPAAPLEANTGHALDIGESLRDLEGDALAAARTVEFATGSSLIGTVASIQTVPDSGLSLSVGDQYQVTATVRDAQGNVLVDAPVTWEAAPGLGGAGGPPDGLTVSSTGLVTANSDGIYIVTASSGALSDLLIVFVNPGPAASVVLDPASMTVGAGRDTLLAATVRDSAGRVINRPSVSWTSSDPSIVSVEPVSVDTFGVVFARVTALVAGTTTIIATSGPASDTAEVTVTPGEPIRFASVSAGFRYACGLAGDGAAYCWGSDAYAALGNGSGGASRVPVAVAGGLAFASISSGHGDFTWEEENFGDPESPHTCAVTADGDAYCWGAGLYGELGHGGFGAAGSPVVVLGGLNFAQVSAGAWHTCGITTDGAAYCWGWEAAVDGNDTPTPVPVPGGMTFSTLAAGSGWQSAPATCGLTTDGTLYCWHTNGDPVARAVNLDFGTLSIGFDHVCGVTTDGTGFCWGGNAHGELGDGSTTSAQDPVAVAGGLTFTSVSAGTEFTCGVSSNGTAYCWGSNAHGQLGDGSSVAQSEVPVAVAGGLTFVSIDAGEHHACGIDADGIAWCWGSNAYGELGDGSTLSSNVPVRVAGQP